METRTKSKRISKSNLKKEMTITLRKKKKNETGKEKCPLLHVSENKKVGRPFINNLLKEHLIKKDIGDFCNSCYETENILSNYITNDTDTVAHEDEWEVGKKLWSFLCKLVKTVSTLVDFQYSLDCDQWIEVKRTFNIFLVDGETIPDLSFKAVLKNSDNSCYIEFYLRCLGRLVKKGLLISRKNVCDLIKIFNKDIYVCVGMEAEKYLIEAERNEKLRQHLEEQSQLTVSPFESLHHIKCSIVVQDSENLDNYKFLRESKAVCGPLAVCEYCADLFEKLEDFFYPSSDFPFERKMIDIDDLKPRYGPVNSLRISEKIKKLCTETTREFVVGAEERNNFKKCDTEKKDKCRSQNPSEETILGAKLNNGPSITVSESDFEKLFILEESTKEKVCRVCEFRTDSMLTLFTHMSKHITDQNELSNCGYIYSNKKDLSQHLSPVHNKENKSTCPICSQNFPTVEDMYMHLNLHRAHKPFNCHICSQKFQSIQEYKEHMMQNHHMSSIESMNFCCDSCQLFFYMGDLLLIHQLNEGHLTKEVICPICKISYTSSPAFKAHIMSHSQQEQEFHNLVICVQCLKIFFSKFELQLHQHNATCESSALLIQVTDESHFDKNSKSPIYTCGKCFQSFSSSNILHKHIDTQHPTNDLFTSTEPNSTLSFTCNICGQKFASEIFLSNHHMSFHSNLTHCQPSTTFIYESPSSSTKQYIEFDSSPNPISKSTLPQQPQVQILSQHLQPLANFTLPLYTRHQNSAVIVQNVNLMSNSEEEVDWNTHIGTF